MSEAIKTTKLQILETAANSLAVALPDGQKLILPKEIVPDNLITDGYLFLTLSSVANQEAVSKQLAENLLNELINAPLNNKE